MRTAALLLLCWITAISAKASDIERPNSSFRHVHTVDRRIHDISQRRRRQRRLHYAYLGTRSLQETSTAEAACQSAIANEEAAGADFGASCQCTTDETTQQATLTCTDTSCLYCLQDGSVCDKFSYGVIFDSQGNNLAYFENDDYMVGRTETVVYTEYSDNDGIEQSCTMEVDGVPCSACGFVDCAGGEYFGISVQCDNIEDAGSFNTCEDTQLQATGVFTHFHQDYGFCYTAEDGCQRDVENLSGEYTCSCTASDEPSYAFQLNCQQSCTNEVCNPNDGLQTCATETLTRSYNSFVKDRSTKTVQYNNMDATVIVEETGCDQDAYGCKSCSASIGDQQCRSCVMQPCDTDNTGETNPKMDCSNVNTQWSEIDFCQRASSSLSTPTPFDYFVQDFECTTPDAKACHDMRLKVESENKHLECTCSQEDNGSITLSCNTDCGDICSGAVCFRESLAMEFDTDGNAILPMVREIQYTKGLRHAMTYAYDPEAGSCEISVDGTKCNSCQLEVCENSPIPIMDCSNIAETAVVDSCNAHSGTSNVNSFLMRLTTNEFEECQDKSPPNGSCQAAEEMKVVSDFTNMPKLAAQKVLTTYTGSTIMINPDSMANAQPSCVGSTRSSAGLWYVVSGTGTGFQASVCDSSVTDFPAQISVYTGSSCENLSCVIGITRTATDEANEFCDVKWHAKEGEPYYIQVHGRDDNDVGNFRLMVNIFDFTSEICLRQKDTMEAIENKQYSCECNTDQGENPSMRCVNNCLMCDQDTSTCGHEEFSLVFDPETSSVVKHSEVFHYLQGNRANQALVIEKQMCPSNGDSNCQPKCHAAVDGVPCQACSYTACPSDLAGVTSGLFISCENIEDSWTVDTCNAGDSTALVTSSGNAGLAYLFRQDNLDTCIPKDGSIACRQEEVIVTKQDEFMQCQCIDRGESVASHLYCVDTSCLKCNLDEGFCGFGTTQKDFTSNGELGSSFHGFYIMDGAKPEYLSDHELSEMMESFPCLDVQDPRHACMVEREVMMQADAYTNCDCVESVAGDDSFDLNCTVLPTCEYCGEGGGVCARPVRFGHNINSLGYVVGHSYHSFEYTEGRSDSVSVDFDNGGCSVVVNGQVCNSCKRTQCHESSFTTEEMATALSRSAGVDSDSLLTLSVDCSNLFDDDYESVVYECGETVVTGKDGKQVTLFNATEDDVGIFEVLSGRMKFSCWDNETTVAPVEAYIFPSAAPSGVVPENDGAILSDSGSEPIQGKQTCSWSLSVALAVGVIFGAFL